MVVTESGATAGIIRPAELLQGMELNRKWRVTEQLVRSPDATGGNFSIPYAVEGIGETNLGYVGFLKALDLSVVGDMPFPVADAFQLVTQAYVFERDLVLDCASRNMRNVVVGLDAGEVVVDQPGVNPILKSVPYIVFERADGDVRALMEQKISSFDAAWIFRVLHGTANGLRQLHQAGISHQDLKPSNVMSFGEVAKIGDLGCASVQGESGLFDQGNFAGDRSYAPPEFLYGEINGDDRARRRAGDMYQLGSMLVFLFSGAGLTPLIGAELDPAFHWRIWPRDYRNVLPFLRDAFDEVVDLLALSVPKELRTDVVRLVRELCDPDPLLRGKPEGSGGNSPISNGTIHFSFRSAG